MGSGWGEWSGRARFGRGVAQTLILILSLEIFRLRHQSEDFFKLDVRWATHFPIQGV